MTHQTPPDDNEEKPLDPAMERVRRKMVRLLVISIGIMMAGLMAVLYAIVYKVTNRDEPAPEAAIGHDDTSNAAQGFNAAMKLPQGARIISHDLNGDRLTVLVETPDGNQSFHIFDIAGQKPLGRISVER